MSRSVSFEERLEERLCRTNLLTAEQIAMARKYIEESPVRFVEALVELELLSSDEVEHIVSSMNEIRYVKLEELQVDIDAIRHVPRQVAVANHCIPIRRSGNSLVVAVSDSDSEHVREELRKVTDFEIVFLMAEHDALEHALFIYYGKDQDQVSNDQHVPSKPFIVSNSWSIQPPWNRSFETFYEHEGIARAREIAMRIASGSRESFNCPVMLIGSPETGKTHLLGAIKSYCSTKEPLVQGILCTGEQLRSSIADYLIAGYGEALKYDLRERSVVLIDDFASAWGSEMVETEIAETISNLRANGATIVVSMTDEQFISGPKTSALRLLLEQGTEVLLSAPSKDAMLNIVSARVNTRNRKKSVSLPEWLKTDSGKWSEIQDQFLSRNA